MQLLAKSRFIKVNIISPKINTYSAYKYSGVEWLGDIPAEWELAPGFSAYSENKRNNKGMKEERVLSLSYGKIIVKPKENLVGLVPESFETYQIVEPGDLIVRCMDLQNDKTSLRFGLSQNHGIITSAYLNLKVNDKFNSKFLYYYLHSLDTTKVIYKFGKGLRQNLSFQDFYRLPVFDIPKKLQIAIVKFLDEKTAKIDEAIAIKEKQIELLKERKQILIQNAVTRGLDPNVPMKDSGVDWIGEIPEHWDVIPLKHLLKEKLKYGANESGVAYDPELPRYIRITDFSDEGMLSEKSKLSLTWKMGGEYLLEDGDILFARSGATVGKCYQFKTTMSSEKHYAFAGYLIKATADKNKLLSDYLKYYSMSDCFTGWREVIFNKATIENIGADKYAHLPVVLPLIEEQVEIVNEIKAASEKYYYAINFQQQQIKKLKEYKSTLITSAVTGKIKVL